LFRWGIASLILVVILDIVVAAALLTLFMLVTPSLSIMAAWFRLAYAAVYLAAISQLVVALGVLGDPDQALRAVNAYDTVWHVGLILFGVHLLLLASWRTDPVSCRRSSACCSLSPGSDTSPTGSVRC
jgi:hypothetical protein